MIYYFYDDNKIIDRYTKLYYYGGLKIMEPFTIYVNSKEINDMQEQSSYSLARTKARLRKTRKRLKLTKFVTFIISVLFIASLIYNVNIINAKNEKIETLSEHCQTLEKNLQTLLDESIEDETTTKDIDSLPSKFAAIPLSDDLKNYIYTSAIEANIPAEIMFSMAWKESTFNPNAKSETNDHGLFQINECNFERLATEFGYTYKEMCKKIYDPYVNTDCSIYIIKEYRDNYHNDNWHHVLMRYNMGPNKANALFKSGVYSSNYSRAIVSYAQNNFNISDIDVN